MRCLVTGATGFIGGAVLRALKSAGHEVVAYVREGSDSRAFQGIEGLERRIGDLGEPNRLAAAAANCDAIVNAAGLADPGADPDSLGWVHVAGTENAIHAAKHAGCRRFVQVSCAEVTLYDGPRSFWNEEASPPEPFGALARTKLEAEEIVRVSGKRGFWTIALRPALVWGPGDTTHLPGWEAEAERGGIRIIGGGKKLLATTHVANLAHAVLCALQTPVTTGHVYYVTDAELSVSRDFFTELGAALGWPSPKSAGPYAWAWICARAGLSSLHPSQVIRRGRTSAFDMSRAQEDLGYEPIVTREQGLAELAAWYHESGSKR